MNYEIYSQGIDKVKVLEIIKSFGKSGTVLSSAVLKARRDKDVAAVVCVPQAFPGSMFMEREAQLKLLDDLLFQPRNLKLKRNLILTVAASGMGKSAFVDEYCRRLLHSTPGDTSSGTILPITITYNSDVFGKQLEDLEVDLSARLLMSYFLANPSEHLLQTIYNSVLEAKLYSKRKCVGVAMECIKEDLRMQSGVMKPKILFACDDVGKCRDPQRVVRSLCTLIDMDNDLECFFTGLNLNAFLRQFPAGRNTNYVPLPLLSFTSSLGLVQSFIGRSSPSGPSLKIATRLARLSGGHPRTIQAFETVIRNKGWDNAVQWNDDMVETVADSAMAMVDCYLQEEEIMLLLQPHTCGTYRDLEDNEVLTRAMEEGKLYTTLDYGSIYLKVFTSPMLLRSSLLRLEEQKQGNQNGLLDIVRDLLKLTWLQDSRECRIANAQQHGCGKTSENFVLRMEMLRRAFKYSQSQLKKVYSIRDFYYFVRYSQNCDRVRLELKSMYTIEDVACEVDFPSSNLADADSIARVKSFVDDDDAAIDILFRPTKATEAGHTGFFILKGCSSGARYVQLIDLSFSAGGSHNSNEFFIAQCLKKIEVAESLAWSELGIDVKNIVHTFISNSDTSGIDWKEFSDKEYSDRRILIMDGANLAHFFGPMLNVLFSCCFDDEIPAPDRAGKAADEQ